MKRIGLLALLLVLVAPASAAAPRILPTQDLWPVWSPDGTGLAFTRVSGSRFLLELTSVGVRGASVVQLAVGRGQLQPDWSPDGRSLVYASDGAIWTQIAESYPADRTKLTGRGERAFAPRWSPDRETIAYLTTRGARNTDLWTADLTAAGIERSLLAKDAIGVAAWAPDGRRLAFQRDGGIVVVDTTTGREQRIASIANPGPPAFAHDGTRIAYVAAERVWVARADGAAAPVSVSPRFREIGRPSWTSDDGALVYARAGGVEKTVLGGASRLLVAAPFGAGLVGLRPDSNHIAFAGPRPSCPGHTAIRLFQYAGYSPTLSGSCFVLGTRRGEAIEGSVGPGDEIYAGAGNDTVHANDGHKDRVDCGRGKDVVYADRTDLLHACEIVHS